MEIIRKKFYFVRHGRTDWNAQNLCQGHIDIPLNQSGREEVEQVAPLIANLPVTTLISSPLSRALETATIIQKHLPLPLEIIDEIKERGYGKMEGSSSAQMYQIETEEEANPSYDPGFNIESRVEFKKRIAKGINRALKYDNPLIVSHGRLFLVLSEILGVPSIRQIPNASIIECKPVAQGWEIKLHQ